MLRYLMISVICLFWLCVIAFLHYTLPQRDVVRIVNTEIIRQDIGWENGWAWAGPDTGSASDVISRDVRFINAILYNGRTMVYRNEDTGFGWPPYFKLDSSNLQAEAADLISTSADRQWAIITHYGWRIEWLSVYPNAVSIRATDTPEARMIPWFNIVFLVIIAGLGLGFYRLLQFFKRRKIDPIVEDISETWEAVDDYADDKRGRFSRWLGFGKR